MLWHFKNIPAKKCCLNVICFLNHLNRLTEIYHQFLLDSDRNKEFGLSCISPEETSLRWFDNLCIRRINNFARFAHFQNSTFFVYICTVLKGTVHLEVLLKWPFHLNSTIETCEKDRQWNHALFWENRSREWIFNNKYITFLI